MANRRAIQNYDTMGHDIIRWLDSNGHTLKWFAAQLEMTTPTLRSKMSDNSKWKMAHVYQMRAMGITFTRKNG